MTGQGGHDEHGDGESPWLRMAYDQAHEWFREHPGAPFTEFEEWVSTYELQVARNVDARHVRAAMDAAFIGLRYARNDEARHRRAAREQT